MSRNRTQKRRYALAGLALSLFLVAAGSLPAMATVSVPKTFTMVVSPTPVIAGTSRAFSVAIRNKSNITLGSINLTVPPLLTITAATASQGTVTPAGNLIQVRSVGLLAGKSMTITVTATNPCKTTTLTWYVMAMSGSNYTGTTFALDTANSKKTTKVNGACSLVFVAEPASAHPGEAITNTDFDLGGGPVQVAVLDGSNNLSPFPAAIAMAIGANPGSGTLGGTSPQPAVSGVASFADLTIDQPGVGYTLVASNPGIGSVTSAPFTIADVNVPCVPDVDCVGDVNDGTTFANVNAKADPSATDLRISLLEGGPDCDGEDYIETTSTVEFSVSSGTRVKEVSISFDSGQGTIEGFEPASTFQVCYQSPTPFVDRHESTVTTGLLPDCDEYTPESTAPCVLSRVQGEGDQSTWVTITFLAPAGDPKGRV